MVLLRRTYFDISSTSKISNILSSASFVTSDSLVDSFFESGRVELNGSIQSSDCMVSSSDSLCLLTPQSLEPKVNINYKIVFEDDFLLIVDKPAPLPIHPAGKFYFNSLTSLIKCDRPDLTLFTVHRLDKETSGLIMFAKSKDVAQSLFKLFKFGHVKKSYVAIVYGVPYSFGEINVPLVDSSFGDIRNAVLPVSVGRKTSTTYNLISKSVDSNYSLLNISLKTGKKHQIRVHLATLGHPLVGDKQYGFHPEKFTDYHLGYLSKKDILNYWDSSRQMLHCCSLSFNHPKTSKSLVFNSKITKDMLNFMNKAHFISLNSD